MRYFGLALLLMLLTILPLKLKYDFGKTDDRAREIARYSLKQPDVRGPLERLGFRLDTDELGVSALATSGDCHLQVESLEIEGQRIGRVIEMARSYQRMDYLYNGKLVGEFPHLESLFGFVNYIFWQSAGIQVGYTPSVAVLQNGKCSELASLRT